MYTIEKLRLNSFREVCIPSAKDLYLKFGFRSVVSAGSVGKDGEFSEPVNLDALNSQLGSLASGQREYNLQMRSLYDKMNERESELASDKVSESESDSASV